jgi:hypothetical protein
MSAIRQIEFVSNQNPELGAMKVHPARAGLVIGNRDMETDSFSVRIRGQRNLGAKPQN